MLTEVYLSDASAQCEGLPRGGVTDKLHGKTDGTWVDLQTTKESWEAVISAKDVKAISFRLNVFNLINKII